MIFQFKYMKFNMTMTSLLEPSTAILARVVSARSKAVGGHKSPRGILHLYHRQEVSELVFQAGL